MIKQFTLGSKEYTVEEVPSIDDTGLGRAYSARGLIKISNTLNGHILSDNSKEQTFYHELVHAILEELGNDELSSNEMFVQSFSLLLHQFQLTKKL